MRTTIVSTSVNADIFAASVDTTRDHSSGGTENFPRSSGGFPGMKWAREIILIAVVLGSFAAASAAETSASEKEKSLPEGGLIGRMRREEEAKKKQADANMRFAIPDTDAAQTELDSLNNTVSNAMRMTDQTRGAEEASGGVFRSVVIGTILLGAGIFLFRIFASQIRFLHNVSAEEADPASNNFAEEESFADFVAAFKVGPTRSRRNSADTARDSVQGEPLKAGESPVRASEPLQMFFGSAPRSVGVMRGLIQEITRATEEEARQILLLDLCEKVGDLKSAAGLQEVLPVWQLAAALEGLVKQLSEKNSNVTPSTLRTVASAVDLLEALSVPGVKSDMASNPPLRLLAADDDALSRHAVSFALKKALNKPDLAENGEAAMALVSHITYDAIFLDVQMPGMNGFETCAKIHRTELNRATPVVFVTCQSDFDARAKSTLSGAMDLIGKPFLTFEITVKALTLAFRGRLNRRDEVSCQPATVASAEAVELSPDVVVKAFFTHAPEHIRTLRTRFEQVGTAREGARQEHLVDLYLAVHSFRAEAELTNFHPVVQLSSAIEARLKKLIEDSKNPDASNLEMIGGALKLLADIFGSKVGADLASEPAMQNLSSGDDLETLMVALRARLKADKQQTPSATCDTVPVGELAAVGK
jgi:CheY-like chemotaxis protein